MFPRGELEAFCDKKWIKKLASLAFNTDVTKGGEAGVPVAESKVESPETDSFRQLATALIAELG